MLQVDPAIPRGRTAWGIYALLAIILTVSSAAPFVRFGPGAPALGIGDVRATAIYLASWLPFAFGVAWLATRRIPEALAWPMHLFLIGTVPAAHAVTFVVVESLTMFPGSIRDFVESPAFLVLTLLGTLQYLVFLAVWFAVGAGRASERDRARAMSLELEQSQLRAQLSQARLDALTSQLRPHFVFNTLNSIGVLARSDPAAAQTMVRRLSALLRAVLTAGHRPTAQLSSELELLDAYVDIQRVRFGDRLRVEVAIEPGVSQYHVPAMICQPLVENAIEHAVAQRETGGSIMITANRHDGCLRLQVTDDGPVETPPDESTGLGIGLANTRERLKQLYGSDHRFDVEYAASGGCTVTVEIPATLEETRR